MQRDIVVRGIQSPYPMVVMVTHTYHHAMEYMLKTPNGRNARENVRRHRSAAHSLRILESLNECRVLLIFRREFMAKVRGSFYNGLDRRQDSGVDVVAPLHELVPGEGMVVVNNFNLLKNCALARFAGTQQQKLDFITSFLLLVSKYCADMVVPGFAPVGLRAAAA